MAASKLCFIILFFSLQGFSQTNRYIIFFSDKTKSPFSLSQPEKFLSAKSISRRTTQGILLGMEDLPVNPAYILAIKNLGVKTFYTSRWLNCLLVETDESNLPKVQSLPFVTQATLVAPGNKLTNGRIGKFGRRATSLDSSFNLGQLRQLGIDEMQQEGYHGENISIAVLDAGFPGVNTALPFHFLFQKNQIKSTQDFVGNTGNVYQYNPHGTEVLSIISARSEQYTGGAYEANFLLYVTEDNSSEYRIEEYNWLFAAEKADSAGVDVITTSVGYNQFDDSSMDYGPKDFDGKTAVVTRAATLAMAKGIVVVCSAGNEGAGNLTVPADAIGILACGAVDLNGVRIDFSSGGPTADNRIKPDVVALGFGTEFINGLGTLTGGSGTSFSAPLVASLVIGVRQAFPFLKSNQVYDAVTKSADQASAPDNYKGYGVPHFGAIKNYVEGKYSSSPDNISVYPNPANTDTVNISFKRPMSETTLYVTDVFGKLLSQKTVSVDGENTEYALDVSSLAAGVYLIKVTNVFVTKTIRFVKL